MTASPTIVSSPGKVLIAGGYLVLDPAHRGLVISTSSRFYTVISTPSTASPTITVRSPQFCKAEWVYSVDSNTGSVKEEESQGGKNKFVRIAVEKSLKVAEERVGRDKIAGVIAQGMEIVILGDNDFYSQRKQVNWRMVSSSPRRGKPEQAGLTALPCLFAPKLESLSLPLSIASLSHLPPFSPTNNTLASVHKTGLGSSAALITSLCAALLLHLGAVPASAFSSGANEDMQLLHNVAQYCHCYAQGKVGSGFDVSSAVWGSQLYRKFGKEALEDLMSDEGVRCRTRPSVCLPMSRLELTDSPPRPRASSSLLCSPPTPGGRMRSSSSPSRLAPGSCSQTLTPAATPRLSWARFSAGNLPKRRRVRGYVRFLFGTTALTDDVSPPQADLLWRTISNANEALAVMVDTLSTMAEMSRPLYDEALRIASDNYAQDVSGRPRELASLIGADC
jgi:mevalonate kinase